MVMIDICTLCTNFLTNFLTKFMTKFLTNFFDEVFDEIFDEVFDEVFDEFLDWFFCFEILVVFLENNICKRHYAGTFLFSGLLIVILGK
jgi:hypothetical protein